MAMTYRNLADTITVEAARNTLNRAGHINPTKEQIRAAERCAMTHLLQTLGVTADEFNLIADDTINAPVPA